MYVGDSFPLKNSHKGKVGNEFSKNVHMDCGQWHIL